MGRWSRYAVAGITGFFVWEVLALVLGNQPNTALVVRRLLTGGRR